jgi:preprotein translocase subunit Sec61beta
MSSGENSGGLMSSAGLVRYFENEDNRGVKMDPKTVIAFCVVIGFVVQTLNFAYA